MKVNEIRRLYLEYFKGKDHVIKKSDMLIPSNDPTLLFTSAGMVQFKPMWVAEGKIEYSRAASCQKCFRTPDLERVGITARHHTFFEMLGNFSFGDYYKKEAMEYAWDFVINVLKLPKDLLWVTVYEEDVEAYELWKKNIGFPAERIVKLGKKDNFWSINSAEGHPQGPCGPCSEIYIDRGAKSGCCQPDCKPGCDCDRFEEFWNLVFPSFDGDGKGILRPLPKRGVDTGMGLERLASILQNVPTNYDIDSIRLIVLEAGRLTDKTYGQDKSVDIKLKVIADHARAMTMLICDGVFPVNEGRGYVLRRIIRRAVRFGKLLGTNEPFLYKISGNVVDSLKDAYPELNDRRIQISQVILQEEERFLETLNAGMNLLDELTEKFKDIIPGKEVFKLHDTFGFPLELTKEIAGEKGIKIDEEGYNENLKEQQDKARSAWKGSGEKENSAELAKYPATVFLGYDLFETESKVLGVIIKGKTAESVQAGEEAEVVLDKTTFYGESGGQIGDTGRIEGKGFFADVTGAVKFMGKIISHRIVVKSGKLSKGDTVKASVDSNRRKSIMRNHTATHLLQFALRTVLGDHVRQSGSYVTDGYFRFDFTHFKAVTKEETDKVEKIINEKILENISVMVSELSIEEAKKTGALAFFGEKYADKVRVVDIKGVSQEFCGGTHISEIGRIGIVKIVSESGVAAGIRRIEAVSGIAAFEMIKRKESILKEISETLRSEESKISERITKMALELKTLEKEIIKLKKGEGVLKADNTAENIVEIKGIKVVVKMTDNLDSALLRDIADGIKHKLGSGVAVLFSVNDNKLSYICSVTKDIAPRLKASSVIKEIASLAGGSGGGRDDMAQGGSKVPENPDEIIKQVPAIVEKLI